MQREFKLSLPQKKQNRTVQAAKPNRGRDSGEQRERGSQRGRQRGEEKTKEQEKNSKKKPWMKQSTNNEAEMERV